MNKELIEATRLLRDLAEHQNGAPLIRHEKEYNKTMHEVWDFLEQQEALQKAKEEQPKDVEEIREISEKFMKSKNIQDITVLYHEFGSDFSKEERQIYGTFEFLNDFQEFLQEEQPKDVEEFLTNMGMPECEYSEQHCGLSWGDVKEFMQTFANSRKEVTDEEIEELPPHVVKFRIEECEIKIQYLMNKFEQLNK